MTARIVAPSFSEFVSDSTLHGVKYMFEDGHFIRR